jgi:dihydrofolate reductase
MVTANGFFEGPNRDITWHTVDDEFNDFAVEQLNETDLLVFGRITYELMAGYWPTYVSPPEQPESDRIVAGMMNTYQKIVVSRTMEKAAWNNTRLIQKNIAEEFSSIKKQPGKEIAIFGSSNLAVSLMEHDLIDEFRIMISPTVMGNGIPLFNGLKKNLSLKLRKTRTFKNGNVLLYYQP